MANSAPTIKGSDGAAIAIEMWAIDKVKPYAKNPRAITNNAIDKVANSLKEFGFRQPVVVDAQGVIVVGHTRVLAARKLGMAAIPVHVAADLTKSQLRSYRLADNKTGELTAWLDDLLAEETAALAIDGVDLTKFGFESEPDASGLGGEGGGSDKKPGITCPACGHEFAPSEKKRV